MLDETQIRRYARHILLPDVGGVGQEHLLAACVAVPVGPGRAANVAALAYLAAAGVGRVVVTGDVGGAVTASEIESGVVYGVADLGRPRFGALRDRLGALNPDVSVERGDDADADAVVDVEAPPSPPPFAVADALATGGQAAAQVLARLARVR